ESYFRVILGAFTVFYGLRLTWISLGGSWAQILKQLGLVIVSMMIGKLIGRAVRLQRMSNRLGQQARERINNATRGDPDRLNQGFRTCAALFCVAPLGILGSIQEGLSFYFYPLAIKAVIDGLATLGFISLFGPAVLLSAIPVLAVQGTLTLVVALILEPILAVQGLVDPINAVGGLLVFCVALVMLNLKRIEMADYLPALVVAPLLCLWCHWRA